MINYLHKSERFLLPILFISVLSIAVPVLTGENFRVDNETLQRAAETYGIDARTRLTDWETLIRQDESVSELEKLDKVNSFFNRMTFVDDIDHWGEKDYWATPIEFLGTQGGDCEDFTIAKYFTLKAMGIEEEKLNLTYVKALTYNVHHMVLTYFSTPGSEPLVLDNINKIIKPSSQRKDLLPIYSFNGTGLWLAKQRGRGKLAGSSSRLKRWQDLVQRMSKDKMGQ